MVINETASAKMSNFSRAVPIIAALIFGLLFIFLTPPWWHHDEPGHFQVAWFYAAHDRFPQVEEYDPDMRLQLAASLDEHGFYDYRNYKLAQDPDTEPWVMSPQANDPKLAYFIYAVPLRVSQHLDIADQLTLLRLISLTYFIALVALTYQFALEITSNNRAIAFFSALFLALLPGAVNQMTAVSNEPLGALLFTVFLFFTHRTLRGASPARGILPMLVTGLFAAFTITTIWVTLFVVTFFTLLIKFSPTRLRKWIYITPIILLLLSPTLLLQKTDPRFWYTLNFSSESLSQPASNAPLGDLVLFVPNNANTRQRIPTALTQDLEGTQLTAGFYAWADQDVTFNTKGLLNVDYGSIPNNTISLSTEPQWFSFPVQLDQEIGNVQIHLITKPKKDQNYNGGVYFQGMTLTSGAYPAEPPIFGDESLASGSWGGRPFTNLIRNASLNERWFTFSNWFFQTAIENLPIIVSPTILAVVQDPWATGWYFQRTMTSISQTYWGKIGASNFELLGAQIIYPLFNILFLITAASAFLRVQKTFAKRSPEVLYVFGWALSIIWLQTILRGAGTLETAKIVIPWARYGSSTFPMLSILAAIGTVYLIDHTKRVSSTLGNVGLPLSLTLPIGLAGFAALSLISRFWLPQYDPNKFALIGTLLPLAIVILFSMPPVNRFTQKILDLTDHPAK